MSGCEWVVEAYGCDPAALADLARIQAFFDRLITELSLTPVGPPVWHQFPTTGGITGVRVLAESHLACHTFPEYGSLCLNLFCCRPRPERDFARELEEEFAARTVRVRRLERPYGDERSQLPQLRRADPVPLA
jgi:S-adenosylmethionine decarboxylase